MEDYLSTLKTVEVRLVAPGKEDICFTLHVDSATEAQMIANTKLRAFKRDKAIIDSVKPLI